MLVSKFDTTKIEITGKQIDRLINAISQHPNGFSSGEITILIAASIAAFTTILIFFLTQLKERRNLKKELIAEERRISLLLTEYYKELVMHKVHKQYWYRASELPEFSPESRKDSHEKHFTSNKESFETLNKIRVTLSEYFKTITHFNISFGTNKSIDILLRDIKSFKPRKASEFSEVKDYNELLKAQTEEEHALNKVYLFYSDCFDEINEEMRKKM